MLRKYHVFITIGKSEEATQFADDIDTEFDCLVSEPSVWLAAGVSNEKGLSFLKKRGNPLNSPVFKDQAYFSTPGSTEQQEQRSLIGYIHEKLSDLYRADTKHVKVKVTKYGN